MALSSIFGFNTPGTVWGYERRKRLHTVAWGCKLQPGAAHCSLYVHIQCLWLDSTNCVELECRGRLSAITALILMATYEALALSLG